MPGQRRRVHAHRRPSAISWRCSSACRCAITVEAHYANGGLGSLIAEVVAEHGLATRLVRCAVREMPSGATGSQRWLQRRYAIDAEAVVEAAVAALDALPANA